MRVCDGCVYLDEDSFCDPPMGECPMEMSGTERQADILDEIQTPLCLCKEVDNETQG